MKTFPQRLLFYAFFSFMLFSIIALISCANDLPVTAGTNPGGSDSSGINSVSGLANKLAWLKTNALSGHSYVLVVNADETIAPQTISFDRGRNNITVTLKGDYVNRVISLSSAGSMFTIIGGVNNSFILDNNITLQGRGDNNAPLVDLWSGILKMNAESAITGNAGRGVQVGGGTFTMNGGTISGNTGGGVSVSGSFIMNGGYISENTAGNGGGVLVSGGFFTLNGGIIFGNTANGANGGGGVYVSGFFTMNGGAISGNTVNGSGGGVYFLNGSIEKISGIITGYASDQSTGNVVKDSSGAVQSNKGHAVYTSTKRKETTAGTEVKLSYNSDNGWDFY